MRIAITGGIAEGKSTVLRHLKALGYRTVSSDSLARDCFLIPEVQSKLASLLGQTAPVSPAALRQGLVASSELRRNVNRLMHPLVLRAIESSDAEFVEVPLLLEACLQIHFDCVWLVTCGPEEQRRRLAGRDGDFNTEAILSTQLMARAKIPFADLVIRTNVPLQSVLEGVAHSANELSKGELSGESVARIKG